MPTASWSHQAQQLSSPRGRKGHVYSLGPQLYSTESPEVISDALAGHVHQVQVRAHDEINNESQWSDWSPLLLVRPWEGQAES